MAPVVNLGARCIHGFCQACLSRTKFACMDAGMPNLSGTKFGRNGHNCYDRFAFVTHRWGLPLRGTSLCSILQIAMRFVPTTPSLASHFVRPKQKDPHQRAFFSFCVAKLLFNNFGYNARAYGAAALIRPILGLTPTGQASCPNVLPANWSRKSARPKQKDPPKRV